LGNFAGHLPAAGGGARLCAEARQGSLPTRAVLRADARREGALPEQIRRGQPHLGAFMNYMNRELRIEAGRIRWRLAALSLQRALLLSGRTRHQKAYSPYQHRVPAGHRDGGQWTRVAGPGGHSAAGRGPVFPGATAGQYIRLERAIARTEDALGKIQQRDPSWRPTTQSVASPGSIEGAIRHAEARAQEAEARLDQMRSGIGGNYGPPLEAVNPRTPDSTSRSFDGAGWIDAYRTAHGSPDLFGRSTWPSDQGTVAVARIDGRLVFGVSSKTRFMRALIEPQR